VGTTVPALRESFCSCPLTQPLSLLGTFNLSIVCQPSLLFLFTNPNISVFFCSSIAIKAPYNHGCNICFVDWDNMVLYKDFVSFELYRHLVEESDNNKIYFISAWVSSITCYAVFEDVFDKFQMNYSCNKENLYKYRDVSLERKVWLLILVNL